MKSFQKKWRRNIFQSVISIFILLINLFSPAAIFPLDTSTPPITLKQIASGLEKPVHLTHAADGSTRLFVTEQLGRITIVKDGMLVAEPFLDITDRVGCCEERGLLSFTFSPHYPEKKYIYVNYINKNSLTVISRFELSKTNQDVVNPDSEEVVLLIKQPYLNHNGGQLAFGPDGYLYVGAGDGGSGGDPHNNAQNPDSLLGKMLRIDPEGGKRPYGIPPDNPFAGAAKYRPEIWASGLRNPWRFSFDRDTGDLYIADVGQDKYEEINFQPANSPGGENYGWRLFEGNHRFKRGSLIAAFQLMPPVAEYDHSKGDCSISGGFVYRGKSYPSPNGIYFYADYCSGKVWGMQRNWKSTLMLDTDFSISGFGEDEAGNIYVLDYSNGKIYLITAH